MKWQDAQKLGELGFHKGRSGDHRVRHFDKFGEVKTVLCIRDTAVGCEYRVLVANVLQQENDEQWFDAENIPHAVKSLVDANRYWKKARRAHEGNLARRMIRWLFR